MMTTDRPLIGMGTELVPRHQAEFESGINLSRTEGKNTFDLPEVLVRFGVTDRIEARVTAPNTHLQPGMIVSREDIAFGTKWRMRPEESRWPISLVTSLSAPTGTIDLSSGGWDPSAIFSISHRLSKRFSFFTSESFTAASSTEGRSFLMQDAIDLKWSLTPRCATFAEYAPLYDSHENSYGYSTDVSAVWLLNPNVQLDARIGETRASDLSTLFVSFGYSIRR